jgi:hypothetical protein
MPAEKPIVLFLFDCLGLQFLVARGNVTGRRLSFLASFGTFEYDGFSCHDSVILPANTRSINAKLFHTGRKSFSEKWFYDLQMPHRQINIHPWNHQLMTMFRTFPKMFTGRCS